MHPSTNRPPPYPPWNIDEQNDHIQEEPAHADSRARAEAAAVHNDALDPSLMSLPAELRNTIYDLLFSTAPKVVQNHRAHSFLLGADDEKTFYFGHEHALLRTCRALRADALPIWYGNRQYRFLQSASHLKDNYDRLSLPYQVDRETLGLFAKWASLLGREGRLAMIRDLHIELDCIIFTVKEGKCDFYKDVGEHYLRVKSDIDVGMAVLKALKESTGGRELVIGKNTAMRYGERALELAARRENVELGPIEAGGTLAELQEEENSRRSMEFAKWMEEMMARMGR